MPEGFEQVCNCCREKKIITREAAKRLGISHTTFYRRYREYLSKITEKEEKIVSDSRQIETPLI